MLCAVQAGPFHTCSSRSELFCMHACTHACFVDAFAPIPPPSTPHARTHAHTRPTFGRATSRSGAAGQHLAWRLWQRTARPAWPLWRGSLPQPAAPAPQLASGRCVEPGARSMEERRQARRSCRRRSARQRPLPWPAASWLQPVALPPRRRGCRRSVAHTPRSALQLARPGQALGHRRRHHQHPRRRQREELQAAARAARCWTCVRNPSLPGGATAPRRCCSRRAGPPCVGRAGPKGLPPAQLLAPRQRSPRPEPA